MNAFLASARGGDLQARLAVPRARRRRARARGRHRGRRVAVLRLTIAGDHIVDIDAVGDRHTIAGLTIEVLPA